MAFRTVFFLLAAWCFADSSFAERLYKWEDKNGMTHYTNDLGAIPLDMLKDTVSFHVEDPPVKPIGRAENVVGKVEKRGDVLPVGEGLEKGEMPPDFTLPSLDGITYNLRRQKGKIVFLNFWATWCGTCLREMPSMQKLYESLGSRSFTMLAISSEDPEKLNKFRTEKGYSFPILRDNMEVSEKSYSVRSIPRTYVLDREGKIVYYINAGIDWADPKVISWFKSLIRR